MGLPGTRVDKVPVFEEGCFFDDGFGREFSKAFKEAVVVVWGRVAEKFLGESPVID